MKIARPPRIPPKGKQKTALRKFEARKAVKNQNYITKFTRRAALFVARNAYKGALV